MSTPREMAKLMALIADGTAVNPTASAAMLATLRRQQDRAIVPRLLPEDAEVGNKTGTDEEKQAGPDGVRAISAPMPRSCPDPAGCATHRHLRAPGARHALDRGQRRTRYGRPYIKDGVRILLRERR